MKKAQYLLGLFYILIVNFLWVSSGYLVRSIFEDKNFHSPFLVTYYSTALFMVYLIFFLPFLCNHCTSLCTKKEGYGQLDNNLSSSESLEEETPLSNMELLTEEHVVVDKVEVDSSNGEVVHRQLVNRHLSTNMTSDEASDGETCCCCFVVKQSSNRLTLLQTAKLSGTFCFIWFSMSYLYNASLMFTTLGSNTVLSTLSGPFCLILSIILLKEPLVWSNILGVAVVLGGSILIGTQDVNGDDNNASNMMLGDSMAILSAFIYGCYTTLMKYWVKDDSSMSMFLFFGLVGLCNLLCLWPLFFLFNYSGIEPIKLPDWDTVGLLTLTGFVNILSDYFWARSILLTSPLIASVGLCLTIPLALLSDFFFSHVNETQLYILGSACVVVGFVLVNLRATQSLEPEADVQISSTAEELLED